MIVGTFIEISEQESDWLKSNINSVISQIIRLKFEDSFEYRLRSGSDTVQV